MEEIKSRKLIILITIFYIVLYIILKLIIVYTQDLYMSNEIYENEYGIGNVIKINSYSNKEKEKTDYFSNKSGSYTMKLKNYFKDFTPGDSDYNYEYYMLYNNDNEVDAALMIGQFDSQMSTANNNKEESIFYEFNHFPLYISNVLRKSFMKNHNINNDVDLIKYIRERKKEECNFFTPITKIKENYFFNFIEASLPSLENITYIEGDIEGYIYEFDDYKQACIIKDDKLYCITFYKLDYFTNERIDDILRSVIIEK